jgi:cytochrome P450
MTTTGAANLVGELLSPAGRADPFPIYQRLHDHGPVIRLPGGFVLIVGYAAAEAALRDPHLHVEDSARLDRLGLPWRCHPARVVLGNSMVFANGSTHDRMRRLARAAFTPDRVEKLRLPIERRTTQLLDRIATLGAGGGRVDFMAEFGFGLPVHVICDLLGIPDAERAALRQPIADLALAVEPGWIHGDLTTADAAADRLVSYFTELIALRRARPGDDLLSAMVAANSAAAHGLSTDELVANAIFVLLAGFETTVGLLGNGLALLLDQPRLLDRLRAHPDVASAFVEEVLRHAAPVQLTGRVAAEDTIAAGSHVPAGSSVIVSLGAANRDPHRFADPDRFDPDRPRDRPLSFGGGAHYCLGSRLGRLEARLAFPMVLARFPRLAPAGPGTLLDRFNLRAYEVLPITVT